MKIDKKLNLVMKVTADDGSEIHIHATPIHKTVFDRYIIVLSRVFSDIYTNGQVIVGPRIAAKLIRSLATELGTIDDVEQGLLNEIKRSANVMTLTDAGWQTRPFFDCVQKGLLSEDEAEEVENVLAFFTLALLNRKVDREIVLSQMGTMWAFAGTYLSITDYKNSLPTSTTDESSSETPTT